MTSTTMFTHLDGPLGPLLLVGREDAVTGLYFADRPKAPAIAPAWRETRAGLAQAIEQLEEYFAGQRTDFDVPLDLAGTPFQQQVWAQLRRIGYGETISYGELARRVGNPRAARAVGLANGRNPVCVIVPCHRVIAADGSLGGYGGGLDRKSWLLQLEGAGSRARSSSATTAPSTSWTSPITA